MAQQEDIERNAEERRNDQRQSRADPVQFLEQQEERNHSHLSGNHHYGNGDKEYGVSSLPIQLGNAVCHERACQNDAQCAEPRNENRIF
ncbi:hypothetical protein BG53_02615 [Paenibacillus darwinianus]|uniref:Uncharacterized protein n=1 Tax=Paenibacillus darwinianus TaxID=1380763 RepID=A0A9W5W6Y7_9BACL|nr:hypothetical protein BG52_03035 [Paenibacillus darwinianus]EXX88041.1 hypothetical protein BG53_02615 [Paenibacillus darwinianus]EXX89199.1 hypothetical protein CH50_01835 [Paenibacillus darwinianus]